MAKSTATVNPLQESLDYALQGISNALTRCAGLTQKNELQYWGMKVYQIERLMETSECLDIQALIPVSYRG